MKTTKLYFDLYKGMNEVVSYDTIEFYNIIFSTTPPPVITIPDSFAVYPHTRVETEEEFLLSYDEIMNLPPDKKGSNGMHYNVYSSGYTEIKQVLRIDCPHYSHIVHELSKSFSFQVVEHLTPPNNYVLPFSYYYTELELKNLIKNFNSDIHFGWDYHHNMAGSNGIYIYIKNDFLDGAPHIFEGELILGVKNTHFTQKMKYKIGVRAIQIPQP